MPQQEDQLQFGMPQMFRKMSRAVTLIWQNMHAPPFNIIPWHYSDVIMATMASQTASLTTVYSTVYSGIYQRGHQSSASLAFVREIHRWPVNSPHKGPVTRKRFSFYDIIMISQAPNFLPLPCWVLPRNRWKYVGFFSNIFNTGITQVVKIFHRIKQVYLPFVLPCLSRNIPAGLSTMSGNY